MTRFSYFEDSEKELFEQRHNFESDKFIRAIYLCLTMRERPMLKIVICNTGFTK